MALSVVDLYKRILPKTNCKDCGYKTCMAFASMVVSEQKPLNLCPHLDAKIIEACEQELKAQYAQGKWTKKDMQKEALEWAKEKSASMKIKDLPERIGGQLVEKDGQTVLQLPYFTGTIFIGEDGVTQENGDELNRWEQVFIYNHIAQGGSAQPGQNWKGLEQIPNTVSKIKSMRDHVEAPLIKRFCGHVQDLKDAAAKLGGTPVTQTDQTADVAVRFDPMPKIPVLLLFWDAEPQDGFDAQVKLLFDATITEHLDIESIMFLSERIANLLCDHNH